MSLSYYDKDLEALFFPTHTHLKAFVMLDELWICYRKTSEWYFTWWSLIWCLVVSGRAQTVLIFAILKVTKQLSMGFRDTQSLTHSYTLLLVTTVIHGQIIYWKPIEHFIFHGFDSSDLNNTIERHSIEKETLLQFIIHMQKLEVI